MNVSLNKHWEKYIQQKVDSGRYQSSSEVIREALRLLEEKEQAMHVKLAELKADIAEGRASGTKPFDAEQLKQQGRDALQKKSARDEAL